MYDFYCLYSLWFSLGGGFDAYGYGTAKDNGMPPPQQCITNDMRVRVINDLFDSAAHQLSRAIIQAGMELVYDEAEHAVDAELVPPSSFRSWLESEADADTRRIMENHQDMVTGEYIMPMPALFWSKIGWNGALRWFKAPFWEEYAWSYGGAKWLNITEALMALLQSIKHDHGHKEIVARIDHIYDLEHNTGMFFDKRGSKLRVDKGDLDYRFNVRHVSEFSGRVSPVVQRVLDSALPHLESSQTPSSVRQLVEELLTKAA